MLPHPFAFDGIDNDLDGCFDIEDPDEIRLDWFDVKQKDIERSCYEASPEARTCEEDRLTEPCCAGREPQFWCTKGRPWGRGEPVGPQVRVLYAPTSHLFLGRDKFKDVKDAARQQADKERFHVLQYWFYYPFDDGPNAHKDDAELMSIFLRETEPSDRGETERKIQALVGAGHGDDTVNNVLVAGAKNSREAIFPKVIHPHTPVLVELGKHASAPDRNCNGRFDLGIDANLYPEGAWGSRDVWAGNVAQALKLGDFKSWYSYSRAAENVFVEETWASDRRHRSDYQQACAGTASPLERVLGDADDGADCAYPSKSSVPQTYAMFPLKLLEDLHDRLDPEEPWNPADLDAVQRFLHEHRQSFWQGLPDRTDRPSLRLTPAGLACMRQWTLGQHRERREIWRHSLYKRPDSVFRPWLLRKWGFGASLKVEARNAVLGLVLRRAEMQLPNFFPLGLGGSQAFHDKRLEGYVHFDRAPVSSSEVGDHWLFYDAGIDFFSGRNRRTGWFVGVTTKYDYEGPWYSKLGLNGGLEVGIPYIRIPIIGRASGMISMGANTQLFGRAGSTDRTAPTNADVRAFVSFRLTFGLPVGPRHPLTY